MDVYELNQGLAAPSIITVVILKYFLPICICLLFCTGLRAQADSSRQRPQGAMVERLFIAIMTRQLQLTVDESQQFWPVFNRYRAACRSAFQAYADEPVKKDEALLAAKKQCHAGLRPVLGSERRTNKVFLVHERFIRQVQQMRMRNRPGVQLVYQVAGAGGLPEFEKGCLNIVVK